MTAMFFDSKTQQCGLCCRRCVIKDGRSGFCKVRSNINGSLKTLTYGKITAAALDPIEKKPLYHFMPASSTFSISGFGCNFTCLHCQNFHLSQNIYADCRTAEPYDIVNAAEDCNASSISFTYNEPTVSFEYYYDICREAKKHGIKTAFITNGYMTEEALREIAPYLNAIRIDLKAFSDEFYQKICGGAKLQPVLDTAVLSKELGLHTELVTLLIPELNDSKSEISDMIGWEIESLGCRTPHHFTAFTPMYKLTDRRRTNDDTVISAYNSAKELGLFYPYTGNILSDVGSSTFCPKCGALLISRTGFSADVVGIKDGHCVNCGEKADIVF